MVVDDICSAKLKLQEQLVELKDRRDKLDEVISNMESIRNNYDLSIEHMVDAMSSLQDARDELSQLV